MTNKRLITLVGTVLAGLVFETDRSCADHVTPGSSTERLIAALIGSRDYFVSAADHHHALSWMVSQATEYGELKSPFLAPHVAPSNSGGRQPFHQAVETVLRRPDVDRPAVIAHIRAYLAEQDTAIDEQHQVHQQTKSIARAINFVNVPGGSLLLPKYFESPAYLPILKSHGPFRVRKSGIEVQVAPFEVMQTRVTEHHYLNLMGKVFRGGRARKYFGVPAHLSVAGQPTAVYVDHPMYADTKEISDFIDKYNAQNRSRAHSGSHVSLGTPIEWLYLIYGESSDRVGWREKTHLDFLRTRYLSDSLGTSPWGDVSWDPQDYDQYDDYDVYYLPTIAVGQKKPYRLHGGEFYDLFGMNNEVCQLTDQTYYEIGDRSSAEEELLLFPKGEVDWKRWPVYGPIQDQSRAKSKWAKFNVYERGITPIKPLFRTMYMVDGVPWKREQRLPFPFRLFRRESRP